MKKIKPLQTIPIPAYSGYNFREVLRFLNRSELESTHRVLGQAVRKLFHIEDRLVLIQVDESEDGSLQFHCLNETLSKLAAAEVLKKLNHWLGFQSPPFSFYNTLSGDAILNPLFTRFHGLPIIGIPDFLECISWAIIGQQINLTFAYTCKKRLVEHYGFSLLWQDEYYYSFPDAETLSQVDPVHLRSLQFSRQKIQYLIGISEALKSGALKADSILNAQYSEAKSDLLAFKGIGPWTADYVLMKFARFDQACPIGDAGLRQALDKNLPEGEKSTAGVKKIFEPWNQFAAFATFYLWQSLIPNP